MVRLVDVYLCAVVVTLITVEAFLAARTIDPWRRVTCRSDSSSGRCCRVTRRWLVAGNRDNSRQWTSRNAASGSDDQQQLEEEEGSSSSVRSMKIKDLKMELDAALVDYSNVFEKEELVRRVIQARMRMKQQQPDNGGRPPPEEIQQQQQEEQPLPASAIVVPLFVITPRSRELRVTNDLSMTIDAGDQFPAIQIKIPHKDSSSSRSAAEHKLTLLVDTACSSLVLRPTVPQRCGLPLLSSPTSTMIGASGVVSTTTAGGVGQQITQLDRFYLDEQKRQGSPSSSRRQFGPFPAALQDIGALPSVLDGIIGIAFLARFAAVDFDFASSRMIFHTDPPPPRASRSDDNKHGSAAVPLQMVGSYGIYTVNAWFDGRGPIRLLVDTGASNTFINARGVRDLGFRLDDLERIRNTGALGSDSSMAIAMTHRLFLQTSICLGHQEGRGSRINIDNSTGKGLEVCIAEIPILASMPDVGGILGIDAFRRCQTLRVSCKYPPTVTVF
jgi:hypothetical protein